ncbi:MAG: hypothetical protein ABI903_18230 [Actinomycetota bacterium]
MPEPPSDLEQDFANAMRDIYLRAKTEAGHSATYFLQMLAEAGPLETARMLVMTAHPSHPTGILTSYLATVLRQPPPQRRHALLAQGMGADARDLR